ncbi:MAG: DUF2460 domain-containing protein [Pseudomonadota bacterium]
MSFHDVLFPTGISLGAEGGPHRKTEIVTLASGREQRNTPWAGARRSYNAGYGVKSLADLEAVIAFFEARLGRLHSFRFRDPFDHRSSTAAQGVSALDQSLGFGDGATTTFQLKKTYVSGAYSADRLITKPVANSLLVAIDGAVLTEGNDFTTDYVSGIVTLSTPPSQNAAITAGFLFDTPVRFDTDDLRINLAAFNAGDIPSVPLIEVFE